MTLAHFLYVLILYLFFQLLLTSSISRDVAVPPLCDHGVRTLTSSRSSGQSTVNPHHVSSSTSGSSSGDDSVDDDEDRSSSSASLLNIGTDMSWTRKHLLPGLCPRSTDRTAILPAKWTFSCARVMEVNTGDWFEVSFPVELLIVSECASDWPYDVIGQKCTSPSNRSVPHILFSSPVSTSKVTYKNIYCAVCNRELNWTDVHFWRPYLQCDTGTFKFDLLWKRQSSSASSNRREEFLSDNKQCWFEGYQVPDVIPPLWECSENYVIGRCPAFDDVKRVGIALDRLRYECVQEQCVRGELDLMYSPTTEKHPVFRNAYCAACNGFNHTELEPRDHFSSCSKELTDLMGAERHSSHFHLKMAIGYFPILIDFQFGDDLHVTKSHNARTITCPKWNVYDFRHGRCRQIFTVHRIPTARPSGGRDNITTRRFPADNSSSRNLTSNCGVIDGAQLLVCNGSDTINLPCDKVISLEKFEYIVSDDGHIYNRVTDDDLHPGEYLLINDTVYACANLSQNHTTILTLWEFNLVPVVFSATVCTISALCCFIVFITYCLFAELRKLPGICTMCYALSIGVSYFILLVGSHLVDNSGLCTTMGFLLHYFCLCQFSWSAIIACSMTRTFVLRSSMSSQSTSRKLLWMYLGAGWGLPLLVCGTMLILDQASDLDIDYATDKVCWLQPTLPLLLGFVIPVAVVLVFNLLVFLILVVKIHRTMKLATPSRPDSRYIKARRKLRIFTGMFSLLSLTWLIAMMAAFEGLEGLWYLFFIATLFQGVSLLVIFVLNKKTRYLYRSKLRKWFSTCNTPSKWRNGNVASAKTAPIRRQRCVRV